MYDAAKQAANDYFNLIIFSVHIWTIDKLSNIHR